MVGPKSINSYSLKIATPQPPRLINIGQIIWNCRDQAFKACVTLRWLRAGFCNNRVTMKALGPLVFLSGLCSVNYGWFNRMPNSVINWENRLCWRSVALDWFHIKFSAELAPQKLLVRKGSMEMVNKSPSLNKLANQWDKKHLQEEKAVF